MPGDSKGSETKLSPIARLGEPQFPDEEVAVWLAPSLLVHLTMSPTLMATGFGSYRKLTIATATVFVGWIVVVVAGGTVEGGTGVDVGVVATGLGGFVVVVAATVVGVATVDVVVDPLAVVEGATLGDGSSTVVVAGSSATMVDSAEAVWAGPRRRPR